MSDTEEHASGGEWPPITGRQWSTAKIANAYGVPLHLIGEPPPDPFYPSQFMRGLVAEVGLLWDHDPTKVVPLVDRRGSSPVKVGDGVIVHDEEGNAVFEGTVDRPLSDYNHFSIRDSQLEESDVAIGGTWSSVGAHNHLITTTKEDTMNTKVKIKVNGPSIVTGGPTALIEIDHDGPSVEPLERAIAAADLAARGMLEGIGIKPFEPEAVITHEARGIADAGEGTVPTGASEGVVPGNDAPPAEEPHPPLLNVAGQDLNAQRIAMYSAVGTVAPNLIDLSKELAEVEMSTEGSEGFRERMGRIGRTLASNADVLEQSRVLGERG